MDEQGRSKEVCDVRQERETLRNTEQERERVPRKMGCKIRARKRGNDRRGTRSKTENINRKERRQEITGKP